MVSHWKPFGNIHRCGRATNDKIIFILFQLSPPPFPRTHPGNGLSSQWRGTSGIKEISRKCAADFLKVCINNLMLIIPRPASAVLEFQNTVSEGILSYISLPAWHIKEGDGVRLKASFQTPAGLNCLLTDGDTKKSSKSTYHARWVFFFKSR